MVSSKWKFPTLFSLYIAQSIPMSFFSTVVPVIMRQEQYSLESIGLLQLIKLPWIFKFLWAPLVDNTATGRRQVRRWIILSELFYAVVILTISLFSLKTDFTLIIVLMLLAFIASATQ
ncbi:MAG: MFS transporter, partial [Bacteroidales bacterium]|nr:MFS transporter [Bacteroidales bacterium]